MSGNGGGAYVVHTIVQNTNQHTLFQIYLTHTALSNFRCKPNQREPFPPVHIRPVPQFPSIKLQRLVPNTTAPSLHRNLTPRIITKPHNHTQTLSGTTSTIDMRCELRIAVNGTVRRRSSFVVVERFGCTILCVDGLP